jgi:carbon storage regulator
VLGIIRAYTREGLPTCSYSRIGETVMIGQGISVTVLGVKGTQVRLGVSAPMDVAVHREEIFERIKNETDARHASGS